MIKFSIHKLAEHGAMANECLLIFEDRSIQMPLHVAEYIVRACAYYDVDTHENDGVEDGRG